MSDNYIIKTENLSKHYGKLKAVNEVSLSVKRGEIYGFLGLNGAGKTTTIRMLLGMIKPDSGSAFLKGEKVKAGNTGLWKSVGYLVEIPYSYPDLTVVENLDLIRRLRFLKDRNCVKNIIEILKLEPYREVLAKNLSLGNAQRLGLAKALIHKPEILLLDEPANGLDPSGIVEIREMLCDLAFNYGTTIFISSHILGEISKFANRIGIIHDGLLIHESPANEIDTLRRRCLHIKTKDLKGTKEILEMNGYQPVISESGILEVTEEKALSNPESIASLLVLSGFPPSLLKTDEEDLEAFFMRVINTKGGKK
jgi:ABC-2 type transport system ATP-binding protein